MSISAQDAIVVRPKKISFPDPGEISFHVSWSSQRNQHLVERLEEALASYAPKPFKISWPNGVAVSFDAIVKAIDFKAHARGTWGLVTLRIVGLIKRRKEKTKQKKR